MMSGRWFKSSWTDMDPHFDQAVYEFVKDAERRRARFEALILDPARRHFRLMTKQAVRLTFARFLNVNQTRELRSFLKPAGGK